MSIVYRNDLSSPMTWDQLDNNFRTVESIVDETTRQAEIASQFATESRRASDDSRQSAIESERWSEEAQAKAGAFSTVEDGLLKTEDGQLFGVLSAESKDVLDIYENVSGEAVNTGKRTPSAYSVNRIERGEFQGFQLKALTPESGYSFAITDQSGHAVLLIDLEGVVKIPGYEVERENLSPDLDALTAQFLTAETGYVFALVDPVTGKAPVRLSTSGVLEVDELLIGYIDVQPSWLSEPIQRMALPQLADVQPVTTNAWRMQEGAVAVRLDTGAGSWRQFPSTKTKLLWGENSTGVNLEARRSAGLCILGLARGADFSPGSRQSINYKGPITTVATTTPSGNFQAGDYFRYSNGTWALSTGTFAGMTTGDLLVFDGVTWGVQQAPNRYRFTSEKTWYAVVGNGWFDGIELISGDRIMYVSTRQGGTPSQLWYKMSASKGDLSYAGEFAPTSGLPAAPVDGSIYQASAPGQAGRYSFSANDYALFSRGGWMHIPNDAPVSIPDGGSVALKCVNDSGEWEVRRADKTSPGVGGIGSISLRAQIQSEPKSTRDRISLISDSMFAVGGVGDTIIRDSGRDGIVMAYNASKSWQVLGTLEYDIATRVNDLEASVLLAWHGENNSSTEADAVGIRDCSLRMANLVGARDRKLLFLSVLGRRDCTFNGSRIVVPAQEDQMAGVGFHAELNKWYESTFPGQWLSPLQILLPAATDAMDPTFPGMTEKQVAAKYGIAPWSFFGGSSLGYSTSELVFKGYWDSADLPSGGSVRDYYIRTGGGRVGNLLINGGSAWTERAIDNVHLSTIGGSALSQGGNGFSLGGEYRPVPARLGVSGFLNINKI